MAAWNDITSKPPPDQGLLSVRRYPEATPAVYGLWAADVGEAVCGPQSWVLPWIAITHWRLQSTPVPSWPAIVPSGALWRDVFWNPPVDQQACYLRRWDQDAAAVRATWHHSLKSFPTIPALWPLPWYFVYKWKPYTSGPSTKLAAENGLYIYTEAGEPIFTDPGLEPVIPPASPPLEDEAGSTLDTEDRRHITPDS